MKAKNLITLWQEWLAESEKLLRVLHEQTVAVTLRDVARVEKIQPELELYTEQIRELDTKALDVAQRLAEQLGCTPNVRGLVSVLEKEEAQSVQFTANKVLTNAQRIQEVTHKNRLLLESEMTYINGTLTLIAKSANDVKGPYRAKRGSNQSILVDAAA